MNNNQLLLVDEQVINYDYLVITTGPKLAFDEIEGLGPHAHTQSICTIDHAGVSRVEEGIMHVAEHNINGEVIKEH
ncbi:Sulfide:quinone oxidoreductase, Type I [hydrothermal vent metagenome]|uniref:Sulfide:quinone oxidoreductase, Type I n=1 Tax=hydrothermal vent metagenome TaxID=652676 RepID=A0A3B1AIX6_9ZZZZ